MTSIHWNTGVVKSPVMHVPFYGDKVVDNIILSL